ncbi:2-oxoglutaramate amidase [Stieleria maiorica]|uniref:2-oxoglutaramate amidase n=1 Tax=Stieleria maiorica TaxID=2795974 RepID=A0A5B9MLV7_9BACT|nr:nitrilase-related carbon-nitrogen hydrolase [Stieleria maiorica]QEG01001.1 2-oxoglutaramate amidase [Stieleria maiorica]
MSGSKAMQIVAVQLNMAWEDKPANHRRLRELLGGTTIRPGSLVIAPEMFETGFSMNVNATAQSEAREGEALLRELARQYDSAFMGGVAAPIRDGRSRNECVVFAPDGTQLARYQKMHPFSLSGEENHYTAGSTQVVFEWQGVKITPFLCYDLRFPEIFRPAILRGAELITVIACWPAKRSEHWVRLLQARAIENLAPVVGVNRSGEEPDLQFDGRSSAFDHMGTPIFEASAQEQILTAEIDIEAARRWRSKFPALRDIVASEISGSDEP